MADWEHEDSRLDRDWRASRDWRGEGSREGVDAPRRFGARPPLRGESRGFASLSGGLRDDRGPGGREAPRDRDERPASYDAGQSPYEPGGGASRGYGDGGQSSYGQMASGSSDSGLGGYGGTGGGYGQPNLNSQWGAGGYGPLNQGLDYGRGGGGFGPAGYDAGDFGQHSRRDRPEPRPVHHDEHHASYSTWRDTQLASHDRDYNRWRDEQARRYDEDYGSWRSERHAAFSKEFEGWRTGRGGQSGAAPSADAPTGPSASAARADPSPTMNPSERSYGSAARPEAGQVHGSNPTLATIADGEEGRHQRDHTEDRGEADKDSSRH